MDVHRQLCGVILLVLGFSLGPGSAPVQADTPPAGPTALMWKTQEFPESQGAGHYLLRRQGQDVTALLSAVSVPCPAAGSQPLFTVPDGYRPAVPVASPVVLAKVTHDQGPTADSPPSVALTVQVTPDGQAHLIADCLWQTDVFLQYTIQFSWATQTPMLWMAGHYWTPVAEPSGYYEEWRGIYRLERLGSTVHAQLLAQGLPLTQQAHAGEPLFAIPYGFRPAQPVIWLLGEEGGPRYELQISPQGKVTYGPQPRGPDGEALLEDPGVSYNVTVTWTTQDTAQMEASGVYLHRPVGQGGAYHLIRRGNTVSALLKADTAPVPAWVRPAAATPLPQLGVHPDIPPSSYSDSNLTVYRIPFVDIIGRLKRDPAVRYDIVGRSCCYRLPHPPIGTLSGYDWQIRFGEDEVGWVRGLWVQTYGDLSEVPVTDPLFFLPSAFRPAQDIHWVVNAQPVDTQDPTLEGSSWTALGLRASQGGRVHYDPDIPLAEAGYRRYITTITWTAAADVCQRSWAIQRAIVRALNQTDHHLVACNRVTWSDLTRIQTLELTPRDLYREYPGSLYGDPYVRFLPHDLSGLSKLQRIQVTNDPQVYDGLITLDLIPSLFLAHVPQLRELALEGVSLTQLPADFLVHTPQLQRLVLNLDKGTELLPGFLGFTPHLQSLELNLDPDLTHLPVDFLAHTPQLRHLRLNVSRDVLAQFPPHLFTVTPHLETLQLRVSSGSTSPLPPGFLQHTPQLKEIVLWQDSAPYGTPASLLVLAEPTPFLAHAPRLQHLDLGIPSEALHQLPPGFLADATRLETVTLRLTDTPDPAWSGCLPRVWQERPVDIQVLDRAGEPIRLPFCPA